MRKHSTHISDFASRAEDTFAGRTPLAEWVVLVPVLVVPTYIVGGWAASVASSAVFGVFYFALTKYRARRGTRF